jgi:hypothetical protein
VDASLSGARGARDDVLGSSAFNQRSQDMVFAADYPFLSILGSMILFFAWVIWIWMMIVILSDVFRRRDMSGWGKAAWIVFLILLPFLGVLVYLIGNHEGMTDRNVAQAKASRADFDEYVKTVADSGNGPAGQIEKAKGLLDSGTITQLEFDTLKAQALAAA